MAKTIFNKNDVKSQSKSLCEVQAEETNDIIIKINTKQIAIYTIINNFDENVRNNQIIKSQYV